MKLAILGDLHYGVRNDSEIFYHYQKLFFDNVFFPAIKERNIKNCFQLGDFFDRRQYINFKTLQFFYSYFPDMLNELDLDMHVLLGNHDVALKSSNHINSPNLLLSDIDRIKVIQTCQDYTITEGNEKYTVGICSWINNGNYAESIKYIESTKCPYLLGHFEINGFELHKGHVCDHGMETDIFEKFIKVISGHFHTRGQAKNILYTGTPYELSWNDWNDQKGFYILDTDTHEMEFIPNPYNMFCKIDYHNYINGNQILNIVPDCETVTGKYVKLICHKKEDDSLFESYSKKLLSEMPIDLQVSLSTVFSDVDSNEISSAGKTISDLIIENVNVANDELYSEIVKKSTIDLLLNLHNELNTVR